eukprot:COSAG01_NODE_2183_length_8208_cov_4.918486_2_plen_84_part_00
MDPLLFSALFAKWLACETDLWPGHGSRCKSVQICGFALPPLRLRLLLLLPPLPPPLQAEFVLPIAPLSAAGLHNFYTSEAASV